MENQNLNLELTVGETNVILRSLGKHPFDEIAALVAKIKSQGEAQLAEIAAAETASATTQAPAEEAK